MSQENEVVKRREREFCIMKEERRQEWKEGYKGEESDGNRNGTR